MSVKYSMREEMEFTVMDARNMEFIPDNCFDLIIDKALFDSVLCSENNLKDVEHMLKEMYRVLKAGGTYLIVSHGAPDNRLSHFKHHINMNVEIVSIPKPELKSVDEEGEAMFHYLYVLSKSTGK